MLRNRQFCNLPLAALTLCVGCGGQNDEFLESIQTSEANVIYDSDDRRDYYELEDQSLRYLVEAHAVALISEHLTEPVLSGSMAGVSTWGEIERLCPDERFAHQPSAAYCSGVLVDRDLVLTSEHCIKGRMVSGTRAVLGYYYVNEVHLAVTRSDVREVTAVIAKGSEDGHPDPTDFAWLRLAGDSLPPRAPARVLTRNTPIAVGDAIITVSAGGGVPLKVDAGGTVIDLQDHNEDYFIANLDAFSGSSGGGVFTPKGELIGVVTRGLPDFVETTSGCMTAAHHSGNGAQERVVYAHRAVESLCRIEPNRAVCAQNCADACAERKQRYIASSSVGCAFAPRHQQWPAKASWSLTVLLFLLRTATQRKERHAPKFHIVWGAAREAIALAARSMRSSNSACAKNQATQPEPQRLFTRQ